MGVRNNRWLKLTLQVELTPCPIKVCLNSLCMVGAILAHWLPSKAAPWPGTTLGPTHTHTSMPISKCMVFIQVGGLPRPPSACAKQKHLTRAHQWRCNCPMFIMWANQTPTFLCFNPTSIPMSWKLVGSFPETALPLPHAPIFIMWANNPAPKHPQPGAKQSHMHHPHN